MSLGRMVPIIAVLISVTGTSLVKRWYRRRGMVRCRAISNLKLRSRRDSIDKPLASELQCYKKALAVVKTCLRREGSEATA